MSVNFWHWHSEERNILWTAPKTVLIDREGKVGGQGGYSVTYTMHIYLKANPWPLSFYS